MEQLLIKAMEITHKFWLNSVKLGNAHTVFRPTCHSSS